MDFWNHFMYQPKSMMKGRAGHIPAKLTNCFELLVVMEGKGHMMLDHDNILLHQQDICVIHPSQVYEIYTSPDESIDYMIFTFDIFSSMQTEGESFHKLGNDEQFPLQGKLAIPGHSHIIEEVEILYSSKNKEQVFYQRLLFENIIYKLLQHQDVPLVKDTFTAIEEAKQYIDCHFNEQISIELLAEKADLSPKYFSALFKKECGISVSDFITRLRVNEAKRRLVSGDETVRQIAAQIGYSDEFYLSRKFKKAVGMAPSTYRQKRKRKVAAYDFSSIGHLLALHIFPYAAPIHPKWTSFYYQTFRNDIPVHLSAFQINKDWETNIDILMNNKPDIIVSKSGITVEEKERLSQVAPVLYYPESVDWKEQLLYMAKQLGELQEAEEWLQHYEHQVVMIRQQLHKHMGQTTFLPLRFFQGGMYIDHSRTMNEVFYGDLQMKAALIEKKNGVIPIEEISKINPDAVLLNICQESQTLERWNEYQEQPLWNSLEAVRLNRVYDITSDPWREYSASAHERVLRDTLTLMGKVQG
ncbi:AraC family transcriptional regulator [Metabacillus halosaccharovorans]|uniref:AraC family transcriptional regulator n=1 Tax=Metabacillus halosaccharovorans TaxID=930124 RepID=UPI0009949EF3|nr:AraC family transcriptional regulator [Metabacillus halosaccharovorans]